MRREERLGSVAVDIDILGNDAWTFLLELIYNGHSEVVVPQYLPLNRLLYRKVADLPVRTLCRALDSTHCACLCPFAVFFVHQRRNGIDIFILHMFLHPFPLNTYTHVHISA